MLGEAISMLVPQVVGFRLTGALPEGATATDLVLTVTQILRETGVVGKFVEYFGHGLETLPLADRATIGNMSPEYGATCGFFPVDDETLRYLRLTGPVGRAHRARRGVLQGERALARPGRAADLLAGRRARPLLRRAVARRPAPAAGPRAAARGEAGVRRRAPELRRRLRERARRGRRRDVPGERPARVRRAGARGGAGRRGDRDRSAHRARRAPGVEVTYDGETFHLDHGAVVIAAITSCTNTSNPAVMVGAGLLAKKAVERGLTRKPWVKSSLAPGSKVVTEYYDEGGPHAVPRGARLPHRRLRLHDVHRELRAAAGGDLAGCRAGRPRRLRRALGQPELRGADPPGGEGELPRLAAARRRVRARGTHGHRPRDRADRRRLGRRGRLPRGHLAVAGGGAGDRRRRDRRGDVPRDVRRRLHRRRDLARAPRPRGRALRVGSRLDVRAPPAVLRRHAARAGRRSRTSPARAASSRSATR